MANEDDVRIVTIEVRVTPAVDGADTGEHDEECGAQHFEVLSMSDVSLSNVAARCKRLIVYRLIDFATDEDADKIRNYQMR